LDTLPDQGLDPDAWRVISRSTFQPVSFLFAEVLAKGRKPLCKSL
jgi:hypothetical protein